MLKHFNLFLLLLQILVTYILSFKRGNIDVKTVQHLLSFKIVNIDVKKVQLVCIIISIFPLLKDNIDVTNICVITTKEGI